MNERIARLKSIINNNPVNSVFYERVVLLEEAHEKYSNIGDGRALLYARSLAYLLDNVTVDIRPDEHVVGFAPQVVMDHEQEEYYNKLAIDNNFKITPHLTFDPMHLVPIDDPDNRYCPEWFCAYGHNCPYYPRILSLGFEGIALEAKIKLNDKNLTLEQQQFLKASIITAEAICRFGQRYHDKAILMAKSANDIAEIHRFELIAEVCSISPAKPCKTFHQAVQTMWFVQLIENSFVGCRDMAFGRVDDFLYPYYQCSFKEGMVNREKAAELFEDLYLHIMENIGHSQENYNPQRILNVNAIQYFLIGGTDSKGQEICNDISFAALDASYELQVKQPAIILRWFPKINKELMEYSVKVCCSGVGYPAYFDERKTMEVLMKYNPTMSYADANSHAYYGCDNIVMPGNSDELRECWHNLPKYLELALHEGIDPLTQIKCGVSTMPISEMLSYEDIVEAFRQQTAYYLFRARQDIIEFDQIWLAMKPFSYESLISKHAIERASSINGTGSDYKHMNNHFGGIATIANSLYAINKIVFEEKRMSLTQFVKILDQDWIDHELLRNEIKTKFQKFGNNQEQVDNIALKISNLILDENDKVPIMPNGRKSYGSIYTLYHQAAMGKVTGASADGRKAHESISESQSGTYGSEKNGPTGTMLSAAKLPLNRVVSGGNNVKIQSNTVKGKEGIIRLKSAIETYFDCGGNQLQLNVLDNSTLLDAVKNPQNHRDLLVRVVGFSANFVSLSPEQQKEIINRNS